MPKIVYVVMVVTTTTQIPYAYAFERLEDATRERETQAELPWVLAAYISICGVQ